MIATSLGRRCSAKISSLEMKSIDESKLSGALCEEAFGVGQFVVVAVVAGVLRADDDEAVSSQVRGEVAVEADGSRRHRGR